MHSSLIKHLPASSSSGADAANPSPDSCRFERCIPAGLFTWSGGGVLSLVLRAHRLEDPSQTQSNTAAQTTPTPTHPTPAARPNSSLLFAHCSQTLAYVCQAFHTLPHTSVFTPSLHHTHLHTPYVHVRVSLSPFVTLFPHSICKSAFAQDTRETYKQIVSVRWRY